MYKWVLMGGYGKYVWSAYAITFSVFIIISLACFYEKKRVKKMIKHHLTQRQ
jgi:heme exporter protein CcmD